MVPHRCEDGQMTMAMDGLDKETLTGTLWVELDMVTIRNDGVDKTWKHRHQ